MKCPSSYCPQNISSETPDKANQKSECCLFAHSKHKTVILTKNKKKQIFLEKLHLLLLLFYCSEKS